MLTSNGMIQGRHLRAVIRSALRAAGFPEHSTAVARLVGERLRIGTLLRDQLLPKHFPKFASGTDYEAIATIDQSLWSSLPHMMGFGHQQAVAYHALAGEPSELDPSVTALGAAFSAGIALLDYLVDACDEDTAKTIFNTIDHEFVVGMFDPGIDSERALARAYESATDPRVRLLYALIMVCISGFWQLRHRSPDEPTWRRLVGTVVRMYEAQRAVSLGGPRDADHELLEDIAAKSVLPFAAMHHIVTLAGSPQPAAPALANALDDVVLASGCIIWLIDDLVDLSDDHHTGAANVVLLHLTARMAEQGCVQPSDTDVYIEVTAFAKELVSRLLGDAFDQLRLVAEVSAPRIATGLEVLREFMSVTVAAWVKWPEGLGEARQPMTGALKPADLWRPTLAATDMLLAQQREDYREAVHHLLLPRLSSVGYRLETHPALLFQRAIILDALLDAHDAGLAVPRAVLDAEVLAILRAKHPTVRGGWNYIPEVVELPPDADDLGMVLQVLVRAGGAGLASVCDEPISMAFSAAGPDGGLPTWIIDPNGRSGTDAAMRKYVELTASGGVHPDVLSNFLYGVALYDGNAHHDALASASAYLQAVQDERGAWTSRWYGGPYYGTFRAMAALGLLVPESQALAKAQGFLVDTQRCDGGWGEEQSDPLSTALAVLALQSRGCHRNGTAIQRGIDYVLTKQEADGGWPANRFISFPTSDGIRMHSYGSRTITSAFCLKALVAHRER